MILLLILQTYLISWDQNTESDLYFYRVYVETEAHLIVYSVRNNQFVFNAEYPGKVWVTALDYHLNESLPSKKLSLPRITGIKEFIMHARNQPNIIPNPVKTGFVLSNAKNLPVTIINIKGQVIEKFINIDIIHYVENYSNGVYIAKINYGSHFKSVKFTVLK